VAKNLAILSAFSSAGRGSTLRVLLEFSVAAN
jgi:hypothetical protein